MKQSEAARQKTKKSPAPAFHAASRAVRLELRDVDLMAD